MKLKFDMCVEAVDGWFEAWKYMESDAIPPIGTVVFVRYDSEDGDPIERTVEHIHLFFNDMTYWIGLEGSADNKLFDTCDIVKKFLKEQFWEVGETHQKQSITPHTPRFTQEGTDHSA